MHNPTTAAILVGGKGLRLKAVLNQIPKPMAPLDNGQPFLTIIINELKSAGIQRIIMLSNEAVSQHIYRFFGEGQTLGLEIIYANEPEPLGTGGSVIFAKQLLDQAPFILLNGDTYVKGGLAYLTEHTQFISEKICQMLVLKHANADRFGMVHFNQNHLVETFNEKPKGIHAGYINAGIYCIMPEFFEHMTTHGPLSFEQEVLPQLMQSKTLYAIPYAGDFFDIGTPDSYQQFNHYADKHFGQTP